MYHHLLCCLKRLKIKLVLSRLVLFSVLVGGGLVACRHEADPPPAGTVLTGQDFYPLSIGHYWIFEVEEHFWDYNVDSTVRYQARETIDTTYRNAAGELTYRVVRARRADDLSPWRDDSVFALVGSFQNLRRTANNLPLLELVFPVRAGATWNANQLNAGEEQVRAYGTPDVPFTNTRGIRYDSTVTVTDDVADDASDLIQRTTVYARRIGPVYRRRQRLQFCNTEEERRMLCHFGEPIRSTAPLYYIARGRERYETLRATGVR